MNIYKVGTTQQKQIAQMSVSGDCWSQSSKSLQIQVKKVELKVEVHKLAPANHN